MSNYKSLLHCAGKRSLTGSQNDIAVNVLLNINICQNTPLYEWINMVKNVYLCQVGPLAATYQNIFLLPSIPTVSEGKKLVPIVLKIYAGAKEVCI